MPGGLHVPLDIALTWPHPNYTDPVTRSKAVLVLAIIGGPTTLVLLCVRLWVRMRVQNSAGWDDWLLIFSSLPLATLTVIIPLVTDLFQLNRHVWDIEFQYATIQRKYIMAIEALFCVTTGFIKISILLFYRRLSSRIVSRSFAWCTRISIGFIAAYSIAFSLVPIFGCSPISAFWDQVKISNRFGNYEYRCYDEGTTMLVAAVVSAAQDLLTSLLPTLLYWNLQIPFRQKVALFGVFSIGYGVVGISIVRAYLYWKLFFDTYDVSWYAWDLLLWTLLELHIGAMCANAPALRVFFKEVLHLDGLTYKSRSRSGLSRHTDLSQSGPQRLDSALEKWRSWRSHHSHKSGYLSDSHPDIAVDEKSEVHQQRHSDTKYSPAAPSHAHVLKAKANRFSTTPPQRSLNDIEMSFFASENPTWNTELKSDEEAPMALPPMRKLSRPQLLRNVSSHSLLLAKRKFSS